MVYQPPAGARDLFPLDVAQKQWIEERLQTVFQQWGYHRIITSTLERLDTLMAGGAIQRSTVIQLHDAENEVLGLRPELTASIARAAVTRMAGVSLPQRFYYNANVFRHPSKRSHNRQQEFYQAGVELLGSDGLVADAEVLLLLANCLNALQLDSWHLVLSEAGLTQSLFSVFPEEWRDRIRVAIAQLDRVALETLPLSPLLRERALWLLDLRGHPADVLQRVSALDLGSQQRATVSNLKFLIELLQDSLAPQGSPAIPSLILDLSLIQSFDYYTGIVFEVVHSSDTGYRVLGQGGRYDQLLGLYHPQGEGYPGIGFVLNIEDLQQTLLPTGHLPAQPPGSDWLVVPITDQALLTAFNQARALRDSADLVRVEVYLGQFTHSEDIRHYARRRGIGQIAWVKADGTLDTETVG